MTVPGCSNPLLMYGDAGAFQVSRSLRYSASDSSYLNRTPSVAGNRRTFTWSSWVKIGKLGTQRDLFSAAESGTSNPRTDWRFDSSDNLSIEFNPTGSGWLTLTSAAVFRDPSAWYHVVVAVDTTQSTSSDRTKIYINNVLQTMTGSYVSQNTDLPINNTWAHSIGRYQAGATSYFDGYLANIHFIDGQALTPASFAETDATTGQWIPKAYTGSYGQVSVAAATGGLPIWNTTDTYGATKGSGTRTDANSASIVLALPMDGTNGGTSFGDQSATIKGSGSAKTVTVNGNTNTSTAQSKFYGSSGSFDGSGDYLSLADSADWAFGSGDFTIETWAYLNSGSLYFGQGEGGSPAFVVYGNSVYIGPSVWTTQLNFTAPPTGSWFHFAFVRNGNTLTVYINGVNAGSLSYSSTWPDSTDALTLGLARSTNMNGYFQDFRIYKGVAKYTANFSPVTISNSFYLQFADNSSNTASTLGKDTSGNGNNWTPVNLSTSTGGPTSVAAASGALPVYNTTDTYGAVKGTGTRTDTNSASIVLAVPMEGTDGGTSFTDESATIKGSGTAKTITNLNSTTTSNVNSKFYGTSGRLTTASDQRLQIAANSDFNVKGGNFTIEGWFNIQLSGNSYQNCLLAYGLANSNYNWAIVVGDDGSFSFGDGSGGWSTNGSTTAPAGTIKNNLWYHFAVQRNGSACEIYINGIRLVNNTSATFTSAADTGYLWIGDYFDYPFGYSTALTGYLQDIRIYKGVAKYTGNFAPPTSTVIGSVAAANDSLVDSPTNYGTDTGVGGEVRGNYCTWNPLISTSGPISNGNLEMVGANAWRNTKGTISVSTGKWYFEATYTGAQYGSTIGSLYTGVGFCKSNTTTPNVDVSDSSLYGSILAFSQTGHVNNFNAPSSARSQISSGDVIGFALNYDTGTYTIYVNNTSTSSGSLNFTGELTPWTNDYSPSSYFILNTGQRAFAYTAPSGFKTLCTQNLPAPLVTKSNTVMDVVLYTGNSAARNITGLNFSPDLVWIKSRNDSYWHFWYDSVRGATYSLESNLTNAEATYSNGVTAFNSDGFSLGNQNDVNLTNVAYAAWNWDAGTSTVSNTQGSITSQVRANPTAGFSVVSYTGSTGNSSVGHGLNAVPKFVIVKTRGTSDSWVVYHSGLPSYSSYLLLNATDAVGTITDYWSTSSDWTSTKFGVRSTGTGNNNLNGIATIAYCFAPVVGYSSFGLYNGSGTSDGPFVYTGFRPRFVLAKRTDNTGDWFIWDAARVPYNQNASILWANSSNAETTSSSYGIDFLSNGFKLTGGSSNSNFGTLVYAAFAEMPFNYSRAR
jgi:hypothetical protein